MLYEVITVLVARGAQALLLERLGEGLSQGDPLGARAVAGIGPVRHERSPRNNFV